MRTNGSGVAIAALGVSLVFMACGEGSTAPVSQARVAAPAAALAAGSCARDPDYVVDDVWSLHVAHTTAPPGSVIAVRGMIEIPADIWVTIEGLTFTCAEPGAGIRAQPEIGVDWLFTVVAPNVRVENLVLDATDTRGGVLRAHDDGETEFGRKPVLSNNDMTCGPDECVFFIGTPGAVAENNRIDVRQAFSAIHFLGVADGRAQGNTITTDLRAEDGIRVSEHSSGVRIVDNDVHGPWTYSGIGLFAVPDRVLIEGNRVSGSSDPDATSDALIGTAEARDVDIVRNTLECDPTGCLVAVRVNGDDGARVLENEIGCGRVCIMGLGASRNVLVRQNRLRSSGGVSGIHFQNATSGLRILDNQITATGPSGTPPFGGIRVRDATGVEITGNTVSGPWSNGLAIILTDGERIEANRVDGTALAGLLLSGNGGIVSGNRVVGAGVAGAQLSAACWNQLHGNDLASNAGGIAVILDATTGANRVIQPAGAVIDNGIFDCDGDGVPDPNRVTTR